jgi:hypothetical protein
MQQAVAELLLLLAAKRKPLRRLHRPAASIVLRRSLLGLHAFVLLNALRNVPSTGAALHQANDGTRAHWPIGGSDYDYSFHCSPAYPHRVLRRADHFGAAALRNRPGSQVASAAVGGSAADSATTRDLECTCDIGTDRREESTYSAHGHGTGRQLAGHS